jgi:hypothetical protein
MSRSRHDKSRRSAAERGTLARQARAYRRKANRFARDWDESKPMPDWHYRHSMCGYGCCW